MDTCVNKLSDSLYNIANTLIPQNTDNITHTSIATDPLMELADQVHKKWRRGECESSERDTIRNEVIDHLKTSGVSKERTAWANVLREKDSKAVWDKINWKGKFDKNSVSSKPSLPDLANHIMEKGKSVEDSTLDGSEEWLRTSLFVSCMLSRYSITLSCHSTVIQRDGAQH